MFVAGQTAGEAGVVMLLPCLFLLEAMGANNGNSRDGNPGSIYVIGGVRDSVRPVAF